MIPFNKQIQALVKEFNTNSRANTMLYKDKDVAEMLRVLHNIDRFDYVMRCNSISKLLIDLITPYHNRLVIITINDKTIHGVIKHLPTRMYTDTQGNNRTTANEVSFRTYLDGTEGIALWVDTGDRETTHLYNAEFIELLNEELQDLKNECDLNSFENQGYEG
jgi:hypothetical protein